MKEPEILIIDLGSQYSLIIGRTIRELGYRSLTISPNRVIRQLKSFMPKCIILSGGYNSVYEDGALEPPDSILDLGVPILGICYGMQWLTYKLGGIVTPFRQHKEYGEAKIFTKRDKIFKGLGDSEIVWASHGDSVTKVPSGFREIALSPGNNIAAIANPLKRFWGVQFHPEVPETVNGRIVLANFLNICGCKKNWSTFDVVGEIQQQLEKATLRGQRAIIGYSGGVDSSTLSTIAAPIFKENLEAILIDVGNLRAGEVKEIRANAKECGVNLKLVNEKKLALRILGQATHSEVKRVRFKRVYGAILEREAKLFGANYIIQGSLATDIIESRGVGEADLIKSHHNIGLNLNVEELHPFRHLFKYEVRDIARKIGLSPAISERMPFPGPGLFVRIIGKPVNKERLSILRWADITVREVVTSHGLYDLKNVSQLIVGLDCNRTVGIKGDGRAYGYSVIVRGVLTSDFMTCRGVQFPAKVRREITSAVTKHRRIVRVYYDETHKPPATTELE